MIRRHRALLPLAFALMIAAAPGPASASHTRSEGDPYYPIECLSGTAPPVAVGASTPLFSGFAHCNEGDEDHYRYEVRRADSVAAKGIVTFDDAADGDGRPGYSALRPGRDQVIVRVSDGTSEGVTTINLVNRFLGSTGGPGDQILSRKGIVRLGATICPDFDFSFLVGSCRTVATVRATIRQRGKPRRTVTIGRVSLTLRPGQTKGLKVKLSKKFVRVLKQARQMKVTVFVTERQRDPLGPWEGKFKEKFTLFP